MIIWLILQRIALEHGLILVDTKYEFGKANDGSVVLIDEVCHLLWSTDLSLSYTYTLMLTQSNIIVIGLHFLFWNFRCTLLIQADIGLPILMMNAFRMVLNLKMLIRFVICYVMFANYLCSIITCVCVNVRFHRYIHVSCTTCDLFSLVGLCMSRRLLMVD